MFQRRIPEDLRHGSVPGVRSFAALAATEACARGILTSVFPIVMYQSLGDAQTVSEAYLLIGLASLSIALLTPWISRFVRRRYLYILAALGMITGNSLAMTGSSDLIPVGLGINTAAVVILAVCFNAYVMDFVERSQLGSCETLRLFYSGAAWTVGPVLGVYLLQLWPPAPFVMSNLACVALLITFLIMRLGNGKVITKAKRPAANPLGFLPRFLAQPRLVAGWLFATIRSCGWWVYVVYLPIYAVEQGYSERLGGIALSITNAALFLTPFMLKWMHARSVRRAVVTGFLGSALLFSAAAALSGLPPVVIVMLFAGSIFLILLDVSGGLPFLMAVKPSERTEMSAVYSTYRDVSGVLTPAAARVVLTFAPLHMVFATAGLALAYCGWLAMRLHPRLGHQKAARA